MFDIGFGCERVAGPARVSAQVLDLLLVMLWTTSLIVHPVSVRELHLYKIYSLHRIHHENVIHVYHQCYFVLIQLEDPTQWAIFLRTFHQDRPLVSSALESGPKP